MSGLQSKIVRCPLVLGRRSGHETGMFRTRASTALNHMRLTLDALETLSTIAEAGSFARAAERLHRVPSALTYTVNKLESDLGVTLFDRTGKRPELTAAGRELIAQGRDLVQQAEALETRVKRVAHGWETQLTIAVDEVIPLDRLFALVSEFD